MLSSPPMDPDIFVVSCRPKAGLINLGQESLIYVLINQISLPVWVGAIHIHGVQELMVQRKSGLSMA